MNISSIINKNKLEPSDLSFLLSEEADKSECLEAMAQKAHALAKQHFGNTILLYTPIYLGNYCVNECVYCGFNVKNKIERAALSIDEVEKEAIKIHSTGLRHILVLTGESKKGTPLSYICECIKILKKYFDSISIEIYPVDVDEYKQLIDSGVDGLTIYQEVYDRKVYDIVHIAGPKKDYEYRLNAPERGCIAGMRNVNIGALLGLANWRLEAYKTAMHAKHLQDMYPETDIGISVPRIRPSKGGFQPMVAVTDRNIVQAILAFRIFLPRVGITVSTREDAAFRDNLIKLGVTKMSAGSITAVGGHFTDIKSDVQFEISDPRSVKQMIERIYQLGYQPVLKDWIQF